MQNKLDHGAPIKRAIYTGVPGGLAVEILRIEGATAHVLVLSQWNGARTSERLRVAAKTLKLAGVML